MTRLLILSLCASLVAGCSGSAIRDVARATAVSGLLLNEARTQMIVERRSQLDACQDEECLNRIEAQWNQPITAYEIARHSHSLLVDALVIASLAENNDISLTSLRSALASVAAAIDGLVDSLQALGVELPRELTEAITVVTSLSRMI